MKARTQFRVGPLMLSGWGWLLLAAVVVVGCCCASLFVGATTTP